MKQLIRNLRTGATRLEEVPGSACGQGQMLVQTRWSLVSMWPERMLVKFGEGGLLANAWQQEDDSAADSPL